MSKGAGHVERAIREFIQVGHGHDGRTQRIWSHVYSEELMETAFGAPPWTKAQERSTLRAMRRIIAGQSGWSRSIGPGHRVVFTFKPDDLPLAERRLTQHLLYRPTDQRPPRREKPRKCHVPILAAFAAEPWLMKWGQAVITSRGGADPHRVTVEYWGRKYQCYELSDGRIMLRHTFSETIAPFCHERARAMVEKQHEEGWHSRARDRPDWAAQHEQVRAAWEARHASPAD